MNETSIDEPCCGDAKCDGCACRKAMPGEVCNDCSAQGAGSGCSACKPKVLVVDDQLAAERLKSEPEPELKDGAVEHLESIARSEREERPLTREEARAQVCRSVAAMLTKSIADTEAELAKAKAAGQDGVQEETGRRIVQAARELGVQLIQTARKLDRPRILRPERSLKVVRPR